MWLLELPQGKRLCLHFCLASTLASWSKEGELEQCWNAYHEVAPLRAVMGLSRVGLCHNDGADLSQEKITGKELSQQQFCE